MKGEAVITVLSLILSMTCIPVAHAQEESECDDPFNIFSDCVNPFPIASEVPSKVSVSSEETRAIPENCRVEDITDQCPPEATNPVGERVTCDGYFWGEWIVDTCRSEDNARYLRYPHGATLSDAPFYRIPSSLPPEGAEVPPLDLHMLTIEELDDILWGDLIEGETSAGLWPFLSPERLNDIIFPVAYAQESSRVSLRHPYDLESTREFSQSERTAAATVLAVVASNFRAAIEGGSYGMVGSETRGVAENILVVIEWSVFNLDPFLAGSAGILPSCEWGILELASGPQIHWGHPPEGAVAPGGVYVSSLYRVYVYENLQDNDSGAWQILLHELIHAANDVRGDLASIQEDALRAAYNEWLADLADDMVYHHHGPEAEAVVVSELFNNEFVTVEDLYQIFIEDPYYSLTLEVLRRADVVLPHLPRSFIEESAREFTTWNMDNHVAVHYGLTPAVSGLGPDAGFQRVYDWLFPQCAGHGLTEEIPGCPNVDTPWEWPLPERDYFNRALFNHLDTYTYGWEPYAHEFVGQFIARGGILSLGPGVNCGDDEALDPSISPLLHEDWEHGETHAPPYSPSLLPERDPGLNDGGGWPGPNYDPTGNNGLPNELTGSEPNDPGYSPPGNPCPSCIDVPVSVRRWPTDPADEPCMGSPAAFNWCWDRTTWETRQNAGICNTLLRVDVAAECACSDNNSECQETYDELNPPTSDPCDGFWGPDWICEGTDWLVDQTQRLINDAAEAVADAVGTIVGFCTEDLGNAAGCYLGPGGWLGGEGLELLGRGAAAVGEWTWEGLQDLGSAIEDGFTCDRDSGETGDSDWPCDCEDASCSDDDGYCSPCNVQCGGDGCYGSGSGGDGAGFPPRTCVGTGSDGLTACGFCLYNPQYGEYRIGPGDCRNQDWNTCCPCTNGTNNNCISDCVNGSCGTGMSGWGGGAGGGIGEGDGEGGGDIGDSDGGADGPGDGGADDGGSAGDGGGDTPGAGGGSEFTPGSTVDMCVVDDVCYTPCECDEDNPFYCLPVSGASIVSCPDSDEATSNPPESWDEAPEDTECGVLTTEEWVGYGELACYYVGYCCTGDDCWVGWYTQDDEACCDTCWQPSEGFLPQNVDNCYPYAGLLNCYDGPAGAQCFPAGANLSCGSFCGCYVGDPVGSTSFQGYCVNPDNGVCLWHECLWTSASDCACFGDIMDSCVVGE